MVMALDVHGPVLVAQLVMVIVQLDLMGVHVIQDGKEYHVMKSVSLDNMDKNVPNSKLIVCS